MKLIVSFIFIFVELILLFLEKLLNFYPSSRIIGFSYLVRGRIIGFLIGCKGFKLGRGCYLVNPNYFKFGNNVYISEACHVVTSFDGGIKIGARTHVARNTILSGNGGIEIGDDCGISSGVSIYSISNDYKEAGKLSMEQIYKAKVTLGDDVIVGTGAVILPGVTIGEGAVIAANAMITKDIPKGAIVIGNPGRVVGNKYKND